MNFTGDLPWIIIVLSEGNLWTGVWTTSCRLRAFEYKYHLPQAGSNKADAYEWLGVTEYSRKIVNRCLNMAGKYRG